MTASAFLLFDTWWCEESSVISSLMSSLKTVAHLSSSDVDWPPTYLESIHFLLIPISVVLLLAPPSSKNVYRNIILANLYSAELYLCRELMHE
jgi:hypothetical protein